MSKYNKDHYSKNEILNAIKKGYIGGEMIKHIHKERAILSKISKNIKNLEKNLDGVEGSLQKAKKQIKKYYH